MCAFPDLSQTSTIPFDMVINIHGRNPEICLRRLLGKVILLVIEFLTAKDDLTPYPRVVQDSVKVNQELGIKASIHVSMKLGDSSNVYNKIVMTAKHSHFSIPELEFWKKRKQYHQLLQLGPQRHLLVWQHVVHMQ
ncbi:mitochondrial Rho GTPase 1-like isoform X2 [Cicer arietinum]|uniref:Mitochondrial Rho GTPase 1-like isoform X2 n=1 Tax=Cicer arietinum TaxID=3827 RepID=A0A1S2Z2K1_CICAR|nr:mitochondrial Rho GTPase 1-like isoform X2 [Cicer arietinum]